jgi:hypothetical protein
LANKQDLPGALDELDLVERLGIEDLVNRQKCPTSVETCAAVLSPDPAIQNGYKWVHFLLTDIVFKHLLFLSILVFQRKQII